MRPALGEGASRRLPVPPRSRRGVFLPSHRVMAARWEIRERSSACRGRRELPCSSNDDERSSLARHAAACTRRGTLEGPVRGRSRTAGAARGRPRTGGASAGRSSACSARAGRADPRDRRSARPRRAAQGPGHHRSGPRPRGIRRSGVCLACNRPDRPLRRPPVTARRRRRGPASRRSRLAARSSRAG